MAPPEWTIVDFIHTGPWWRNRGEFRSRLVLFSCLEFGDRVRDPYLEPLAYPPAHVVCRERSQLVLGQWYVSKSRVSPRRRRLTWILRFADYTRLARIL